MNTNESVAVHMKAIINDSYMANFVSNEARKVLNGEAFNADLADLFAIEVVTRPSGSRYVIVDFA